MYAPYFGLSHEPFSIAPDPRYLFMSERHREAQDVEGLDPRGALVGGDDLGQKRNQRFGGLVQTPQDADGLDAQHVWAAELASAAFFSGRLSASAKGLPVS